MNRIDTILAYIAAHHADTLRVEFEEWDDTPWADGIHEMAPPMNYNGEGCITINTNYDGGCTPAQVADTLLHELAHYEVATPAERQYENYSLDEYGPHPLDIDPEEVERRAVDRQRVLAEQLFT